MSLHVDSHNLLAHVEGHMTLPALARALEDQGFALPIARPLPRMTFARAAVALPYLVDAFVQQAAGNSASGAVLETVCAPRSATGPSLVHALCARPPLWTLTRARVRIAPRARVRCYVAELATAAEAAALVVDIADEGRALAVEAVATRVVALTPLATRSRMSRFDTVDAFAHTSRGFLSSTVSIGAGDRLAMADALARGARVLCAPFMGRAAIGMRAPVRVGVPEMKAGVAALVDALTAQEAS